MIKNLEGYIAGASVIVYFVLTGGVPMGLYLRRTKVNPHMTYTELPTQFIILHFAEALLLAIGCFIGVHWNFYFVILISGAAFHLINYLLLLCVKEFTSFQRTRTTGETQEFLENLRKVQPQAQIFVRCFHIETYFQGSADGRGVRTRDITTYTETRYLQITGYYDQTPPLLIAADTAFKYLFIDVKSSINWLGSSTAIIKHQREAAYLQNKHRDQKLNITYRQFIPGLFAQNLTVQGKKSCNIGIAAMMGYGILSLESWYLCYVRSMIPKVDHLVVKFATLEPIMAAQDPTYFQTVASNISAPKMLQENTLPYFDPDYIIPTSIAPPGGIQLEKTETFTGDVKPAAVENPILIPATQQFAPQQFAPQQFATQQQQLPGQMDVTVSYQQLQQQQQNQQYQQYPPQQMPIMPQQYPMAPQAGLPSQMAPQPPQQVNYNQYPPGQQMPLQQRYPPQNNQCGAVYPQYQQQQYQPQQYQPQGLNSDSIPQYALGPRYDGVTAIKGPK